MAIKNSMAKIYEEVRLLNMLAKFNSKYMGHNNQDLMHFKKFLDWTVIQLAELIRGRNP